jgi:hypothetical protein
VDWRVRAAVGWKHWSNVGCGLGPELRGRLRLNLVENWRQTSAEIWEPEIVEGLWPGSVEKLDSELVEKLDSESVLTETLDPELVGRTQ